MKPYSKDLCERIIKAYWNGEGSIRDIAKRFMVSPNFVWLLLQRHLSTGSVDPKPHRGGRPSVMTELRLLELRELVEAQNDATLEELRDRFQQATGVSVSVGTISLALKKLGLSRKKKTFHATERETDPEIVQEREAYIERIPEMDAQHLVFVDEFGINLGMAREYGRAPVGERAEGRRPYNAGGNVTVIGALNAQGAIAPLMFPGAVNGKIFEAYVEQILAPELKPGDTVLFDNLSSHKSPNIESILNRVGATSQWLPRYSPELSPVENSISKIKTELRKLAARSYEALVDAVKKALDNITQDNAKGWFRGCGYCIEAG